MHGDFRLDNAIVAADDPGRVLAILDWEMATLGDPLADLALFNLFWEGWAGLDNPIAATPTEHGFPSAAALTPLDAGDRDTVDDLVGNHAVDPFRDQAGGALGYLGAQRLAVFRKRCGGPVQKLFGQRLHLAMGPEQRQDP